MREEFPRPCLYCSEFTLNDEGICDDCEVGIAFANEGPEAA